jgi:hypothetical protein
MTSRRNSKTDSVPFLKRGLPYSMKPEFDAWPKKQSLIILKQEGMNFGVEKWEEIETEARNSIDPPVEFQEFLPKNRF